MNQYKEKLKLDIFVNALIALSLLAVAVYAVLGQDGLVPFPDPVGGDAHWASGWRGFISGACTSVLGMLVFFILRNLRALKDEAFLKKLYIRENDERTIKIWTCARDTAYRTFLVVDLAAGIVAGFFSMTVCITIIACGFFAAVIGFLFSIYYRIKF